MCGSTARTDLCGGRSAMIVPTATDNPVTDNPVTDNPVTESAGINRHIVGDARALRKRRSDSILASSLACVSARKHSEA